jgi:Fe-S oxidoreductase
MKTKKIPKTIIGYDYENEISFKTSIEAKKNAFKQLSDYCSTFLTIQDLNAFSINPTGYFKESFLEQTEGDFSPLVPYESKLNLCNISLSKIQRLEAEFLEIEIKNFDVVSGASTEVDFNIYATNESQVKTYEKTKKLVDVLNELRKEYTIYAGQVVPGCSNIISFDFRTNQFIPNLAFIQSTIR